MHYSTILALSSAAGFANATPLNRRAVPTFAANTVWDIVLNSGNVSLNDLKNAPGSVIDIDLLDIIEKGDTTTIPELAKTKKVICYFSAGTREEWRKDNGDFKNGDSGIPMVGWKGEFWVNVRSTRVKDIMKKRIEAAAKAGCSAVDPDNVDGYDENQDGYNYPMSAYVDYVKAMAKVASDNNMAIGLKNAVAMIPDLLPVIQFAVNEECHEWEECGEYADFAKPSVNKAVFNIEYNSTVDYCSDPDGTKLSSLFKPLELNVTGGQCNPI